MGQMDIPPICIQPDEQGQALCNRGDMAMGVEGTGINGYYEQGTGRDEIN